VAMRIYVAAMKMREMRERAREREVRMRMCFFIGVGPEPLGSTFASGSALEVVASAGAGSCESSGAVSESAAVIWGDEGVGAAGDGDGAGEVSAIVMLKNVVCGKAGWGT